MLTTSAFCDLNATREFFRSVGDGGTFAISSKVGHSLSCVLRSRVADFGLLLESNASVAGKESLAQTFTTKAGAHDTKEKLSVAVLCHGLFASKEHQALQQVEDVLLGRSRHGKNAQPSPVVDLVVKFDFHGNGESGGVEDWSLGGNESETRNDLRAIVEFLRSKSMSVVLLFGHSRGAVNVLMYGWLFGDVPLIIAAAGRYDQREGLTRSLGKESLDKLMREEIHETFVKDQLGQKRRVTKDCILKRMAINGSSISRVQLAGFAVDVPPALRLKAIGLIHGEEDLVVPVQAAHDYYAAISGSGPVRRYKRIIPKAMHGLEFPGGRFECAVAEVCAAMIKDLGSDECDFLIKT